MSVRDVVQAAAGVGGDDNLYVEDVFSTYLYTGNGSTQTIANGIALGDTNYGPAVQFDGVDDFLSRSTALTGAVDSKTFTASFWVFRNPVGTSYLLAVNNFSLIDYTTAGIKVRGSNGSGSGILDFYIPQASLPLGQWSHVLVSINMESTSQRHVYVNDSPVSVTYTIYTNELIDFTGAYLYVGNAAATTFRGRLSNVYLDTTYRDLTVEANRRIFITADDQPATGLASLNPIIYFPFNNTTAINTNLGTGGDYVINGAPKVLSIGGPYTQSGYGQGGLVWIKDRNSGAKGHGLFDTVRGGDYKLQSQSTNAQFYATNQVTSFNAEGFSLGSAGDPNGSGTTYASWTFRKAPKFFDVVTYTGTGVNGRTVAHNLESTPGFIIVKQTSAAGEPWYVYHRSLGTNTRIYLSSTAAASSPNDDGFWTVAPTSTEFSVAYNGTNKAGSTYVAYLFAHDAGGFGDDGEQNIISCGSYTTDAGGEGPEVNLGWEPQFIIQKDINYSSGSGGDWDITDNTRGFLTTALMSSNYLEANTATAEQTNRYLGLNSTGFRSGGTASHTYIYIAIRRGPMKTPESGTEVFDVVLRAGTGENTAVESGVLTDLAIIKNTGPYANQGALWTARPFGFRYVQSNLTSAETGTAVVMPTNPWDLMGGMRVGTTSTATNALGYNFINYHLKRAPGVLEVVAYTGTGVAGHTVSHNLNAVPELMIVKNRNGTEDWLVYSAPTGITQWSRLNTTLAFSTAAGVWNGTLPTSTEFTLGNYTWNNGSAKTYVAYLFATLPGISKVSSYIGTGADLNVDCGFSAGARFVLIKRTDSTGDWYVWDSVRGIAAGNDPYFLLNSSAAQNPSTDYIDPLASGFTVTSLAPAALNASGGSYIFLAIA